jgi:16S rRNA (guanine1516-N2)-methyltransferase
MIKVCVLNTAEKASELANALGLMCEYAPDDSFTHAFEYVDNRLQLKALRKDAPGAVSVDFVSGALAARAKKSGVKSEAVARAVGLKKHPGSTVLDATAGLGRDSFILASLGCEVTMLESSKYVAALLNDGLKCAVENAVPAAARMSLHEVDAIAFMQSQPSAFDVVYLDPMFPPKAKRALVKKEMQLLQEVVSGACDNQALFDSAFACARHRIVVKRARISQGLVALPPSFTYEGKSNRFDIYIKS